jgi:hypothetical protein
MVNDHGQTTHADASHVTCSSFDPVAESSRGRTYAEECLMKAACGAVILAGFFFLGTIVAFSQAEPDPWLILASGEKGAINAQTRRSDLVRVFGASNVVDQDVDVGEGETEPGTIVFPKDPQRSIEILWNDAEKKAEPSTLTIRGNKSHWKTVQDISLGTSLKQLELLNGKAFHMSGYGWDYSGTVTSWDKGTLARDLGEFGPGREHGRVILRLTCDVTRAETTTEEEDMQVVGDRDFSSTHAVLQKVNPCVGEMVWVFPAKAKN